jgi:hypothetical protein
MDEIVWFVGAFGFLDPSVFTSAKPAPLQPHTTSSLRGEHHIDLILTLYRTIRHV